VTPVSLYMLDTNMASYLVSGRSPALRRNYLDTEPHAAIAISTLTEAEIRFGLEKKAEAARLRSAVEEFFLTIQILPWDSQVARAYGKLRAGINATGKSLSLMDFLIAAHALSAGAILVSHDGAFGHLSSFLTVVDWATDL
jgi:tRNA(fMet)-specific endonuclease VapC